MRNWSSLLFLVFVAGMLAVIFVRDDRLYKENDSLKHQLSLPAPISLSCLPDGEWNRVSEKRFGLVEARLGTVPRSPNGTMVAVYCAEDDGNFVPNRFEVKDGKIVAVTIPNPLSAEKSVDDTK